PPPEPPEPPAAAPAADPERPEDGEGTDENTADVIPLKIFDARQEARKSWSHARPYGEVNLDMTTRLDPAVLSELDIDAALVSLLIAEQFPEWAGLPVKEVVSAGTDDGMYRLGDDMVVRLPRRPTGPGQADKEQRWLPRLAPHLPLAVPVPLAKGEPGEGYALPWGVFHWLDGANITTRLSPVTPNSPTPRPPRHGHRLRRPPRRRPAADHVPRGSQPGRGRCGCGRGRSPVRSPGRGRRRRGRR
ncbi:phosphotransferase, partial [Streptomyces phaeochromogenes]|uniref:phosphotransferase n=1 Tax=Streptomyces phaeochromogenes TaxID=1923 RepID=UPI0034091A2D